MRWNKLGKLFEPDGSRWWMRTHASNPVAEILERDLVRIYFSGRDTNNHAHLSFADLDLSTLAIIGVCDRPVLQLGKRGTFDDSGMSMGCLLQYQDETYVFYLGWNLGTNVPFRNAIGAAIARPDGRFERVSDGPILDRAIHDPLSLSYPFILHDSDGALKMWYGSHLRWGDATDDMVHGLKIATGTDPLHWTRTASFVIAPDDKDYAFSKPSVMRDGDIYRMWYAVRGGRYRIGYAESSNGLDWIRKDELGGLNASDEGWDSEMVCYPHVFDHGGSRYMLYNGNGYGRTGFGLAVLEHG